jgi:alpha-tubulin suppressor-like RCC1 family protein
MWSWGGGSFGRTALNTTTDYSSPKQVGSLTNWSTVSMQRLVGGSVKTDGTLWTWGWNSNASGAMGVGNTTNYSSPKQVGALTTWLSVKIGQKHLLALSS